jgi:ubiquinone/menaquinone biosynthesis C-methylase UbiE
MKRAEIFKEIKEIITCPKCRVHVDFIDDEIRCKSPKCGFISKITNDIFCTEKPTSMASFFDDKHVTMTSGNETKVTQELFYSRQAELAESYFKPGQVILDVGCGPSLSYKKNKDCYYIGLDYSFDSLRANTTADFKIYGSAASLPIADHSVDTVICFYSIHHMVGNNLNDNTRIVDSAFQEFGRVLKKGGNLLIFEISPIPPFGLAENLVWNFTRSRLKNKLDMYFWTKSSVLEKAQRFFPHATANEKIFKSSPVLPVYPVFALRWLKIPRFLYPFHVTAYQFHF